MACLYGICECEQPDLYDMKHGKLSGIITPIEMCMKCELKMRTENENDMKHGT